MNKSLILDTMYGVVDAWTATLPFTCAPGCCACCTDLVTITAAEGEKILVYCLEQGLQRWLGERLAARPAPQPPPHTLNDFAAACLEGRELAEDLQSAARPCLFLHDGRCRIYPARPLACRLFASTEPCHPQRPAEVPPWYFDAVTALTQVVEHLGQKEYWGRLEDVLLALLDISRFAPIACHLDPILTIQARLRTLPAKPLPGFLIPEDEEGRVEEILHRLFSAEVDGKRLGDILDGR
jgi:Fe-S-cluster containining protein